MTKIKLQKFSGFTLIELLIASFIFASVIAIVYSLLNEAMISKRELDLTLRLNEKVKNANEMVQSAMREANGTFFSGDKENGYTSGTGPIGFFITNNYWAPNVSPAVTEFMQQLFQRSSTETKGKILYIKNKEKNEVYIFRLDSVTTGVPCAFPVFTMETWSYDASITPIPWKKINSVDLFKYYYSSDSPSVFEISLAQNSSGSYRQSTCDKPPYNSWVKLKTTAVESYGNCNKVLSRSFDQVYVPLVLSNPYL